MCDNPGINLGPWRGGHKRYCYATAANIGRRYRGGVVNMLDHLKLASRKNKGGGNILRPKQKVFVSCNLTNPEKYPDPRLIFLHLH